MTPAKRRAAEREPAARRSPGPRRASRRGPGPRKASRRRKAAKRRRRRRSVRRSTRSATRRTPGRRSCCVTSTRERSSRSPTRCPTGWGTGEPLSPTPPRPTRRAATGCTGSMPLRGRRQRSWRARATTGRWPSTIWRAASPSSATPRNGSGTSRPSRSTAPTRAPPRSWWRRRRRPACPRAGGSASTGTCRSPTAADGCSSGPRLGPRPSLTRRRSSATRCGWTSGTGRTPTCSRCSSCNWTTSATARTSRSRRATATG